MLTEVPQQYYTVKVFGQPWGPKHPTYQLAEASLHHLPPEQRQIAEIVPIERDSGKEILFG